MFIRGFKYLLVLVNRRLPQSSFQDSFAMTWLRQKLRYGRQLICNEMKEANRIFSDKIDFAIPEDMRCFLSGFP